MDPFIQQLCWPHHGPVLCWAPGRERGQFSLLCPLSTFPDVHWVSSAFYLWSPCSLTAVNPTPHPLITKDPLGSFLWSVLGFLVPMCFCDTYLFQSCILARFHNSYYSKYSWTGRVSHSSFNLYCLAAVTGVLDWCSREGNGNPLQYSCLENSMERGTWWAAVHRVTQNQTWLKRLGRRENEKWKWSRSVVSNS